ncbi:RloB family protein [Clostridium manihotivorum]|uniref:RloB domain-containing protein n=1 Tax=Clostridium manihotivorum TaxID=2320868 RepID=A0A410DQJ9_9CLOT|nr:RloB family protein [Clostridium manihotivorum]QAA31290.1 hypothetical protein C1I91_06355 [Clostridium manihotivorum]
MAVRRNVGGLSREKRHKRKIKPTILIISEGKDTEVNYFREFNQKYVNVDIKIADRNSAGKNKARKTDPSNLVDKAIEYIENKYDINEEDGDKVWCLIDVDLNYNNPNPIEARTLEMQKAYNKTVDYEKKKKKTIRLGISNPCFEIWYLLHFIYTTANFKNYDSLKMRLEKDTLLSNYEKNKNVYQFIHHKTPEAIANCEKLRNYHVNLGKKLLENEQNQINLNVNDVITSNPYTNVDQLVKYIEFLNNR